MINTLLAVAATYLCLATSASTNKPEGLVAEWNFDSETNDVARDSSGQGHAGKIFGATRTKHGNGFTLDLDGKDDYVDCGSNAALGISGPVTVEAWLKPTRKAFGEATLFGTGMAGYVLTYYNTEICIFYIGSGGNSVRGKLNLHAWNHVVASFDGQRMRMWVNGQKTGDRESKHKTYSPDGHIMIGMRGRADLPRFQGPVDAMRVYNRALDAKEAIAHFKDEAPHYGFDPTWFERVKVTPYYYFDRDQIVIMADYKGLQPLSGQGQLHVTLARGGAVQEIIARRAVENLSDDGLAEVTLACADLEDGDYIVRVQFEDAGGPRPVEELSFSYPQQSLPLPAPAARMVGPLPPPVAPTPFKVNVGKAGGFQITTHGARYAVQSRVSWPNGEFNRLIPGNKTAGDGERSWSTRVRKVAADQYEITAEGNFYTIQRDVEVFPTHVYVKDTYINKTKEDLGLLIYNEIPVAPDQITRSYLSGNEQTGRLPVLNYPDYAPSLYFNDANSGMGLIPIDDVYVVQAAAYVENNAAGVCTEKFALGPEKSYTLEWAIYPTHSRDYYDFINTFRKVEDRISTVAGAPGFISWGPMNRRQVPSKDFIDKRGIKIGILSCLSRAADYPDVSIEGIEFMDFPKEMMLLKGQADAIHKKHPGFKVVFHIAHSLYMTNEPDRFADSKVILANGKQAVWGASEPYVSKKAQADGWTWWVYYPTPGNSFHDAMMKSVDVMMDDLGYDGGFMDGYMAAYISSWTYDTDLRWDGHSAEIDLKTKTIKRKMSSVVLLSLPSMIEYSRKIRDKGGIVIGNSAVFTRSIANEKYVIYDSECASGPALHVAPSVTALAAPPFKTEKDIYLDMLDKLSWGMLFLYYNERLNLDYPSLAARQFPITFEEIRSGMVRGKERIVTMNSGVYGWPGKPNLHVIFKYDNRGAPVSHDYTTTVDSTGVRSELRFATHESAVIEPIPVSVTSTSPVNARVLNYDETSLNILLNGQGAATIDMFVGTFYPDIRDGLFTDGGVNPADINHGAPYDVTINGQTITVTEIDGTLSVPLQLDSQAEVHIARADVAQ